MVNDRFDFLSKRLTFIKVTTDDLKNIELCHYLNVFENHVYGVFLQYNRIKKDLNLSNLENYQNIANPKAGLDIFFYILTWDKLKAICEKINGIINRITNGPSYISETFKSEYRNWRRVIEHLFKEFDGEIRNEYVHPSMEFYSVGNIIMWGNIIIDNSGNIEAHAGKDKFTKIKKDHCIRIKQLRSELFDLFIKHFSQKPLNSELINIRNYIEDNIGSLLKQLNDYRAAETWEEFNNMLNQLIICDINLSMEGISLSDLVKNKLYSILN